jgi:hypothetical protein
MLKEKEVNSKNVKEKHICSLSTKLRESSERERRRRRKRAPACGSSSNRLISATISAAEILSRFTVFGPFPDRRIVSKRDTDSSASVL